MSRQAHSQIQTNQRKQEHLDIVLHKDTGSKNLTTGLEHYYFEHQALPEISLADVDPSITLFGKRLAAPLIISPMTGGVKDAARLNRNLAESAQAFGVAMGVGSQRCAVDDDSLAETFSVRDAAPDILLFANLGAVQLNYGFGIKECRRAIDMIDADGLVLHLNPLHEALQPDGNTDFSNLLPKISHLCRELACPVIAKEVGFGISRAVANRLADAGIAGIDVAGAGGTSWSEVERHRARGRMANNIAASFGNWGIPTAESIAMVKGVPDITLIASGGIRTGIDAAKCIALGANAAGIATPFLQAADESADAVKEKLGEIIAELKITMFCLGITKVEQLKNTPLLHRRTKDS